MTKREIPIHLCPKINNVVFSSILWYRNDGRLYLLGAFYHQSQAELGVSDLHGFLDQKRYHVNDVPFKMVKSFKVVTR